VKVYFDTCIVIYRIERVSPWAAQIDALCAQHQPIVVVSDLVRMESLIVPLRRRDAPLRDSFLQLFAQIEVVGLPAVVFDLAAELRATFSLKTPDALHAACAIHHGCDALWTNDHRLSVLSARLHTRVIQ
jgi:predicted nucleic acid-binding protein